MVGEHDNTDQGGNPNIDHWNGTTWQTYPIANPGSYAGLAAVVAASSSRVWAVGAYYVSATPTPVGTPTPSCTQCTFLEYYNGTSWTEFAGANHPLSVGNVLNGVAHLPGGANVVAVGAYNPGPPTDYQDKVLAEQCGTSSCTEMNTSLLNGSSIFSALASVAVVNSNNIWAVGFSASNSPPTDRRPLVANYTGGSSWGTPVPVPTFTSDSYLNGVDVYSQDDIWAVGAQKIGTLYKPLIMHYDGHGWSVADVSQLPAPPLPNVELKSVFVTRERDVWAVGVQYASVCSPSGAKSSPQCSTPTPRVSPSAIWGVWGADDTVTSTFGSGIGLGHPTDLLAASQPIIMHWHGSTFNDISKWDINDSPSPGTFGNQLLSVAAQAQSFNSQIPITSIWSAGNYRNAGTPTPAAQSLVEDITAPTAPLTTTSIYENSLDYHMHKQQGCNAAQDLTTHGEVGLLILDYGKPKNWGDPVSPYGTLLIGSLQQAYIHHPYGGSDIFGAVESFAYGYIVCRNGAPGPPLIIAPGINNDSQYSPAELTTAHAQAWAAMIKQIQFDFRANPEVSFAAAIDAEPDYAIPAQPEGTLTPTPTMPPDAGFPPVATWATGYSNQGVSDYYDFGSLDAYPCPPYPTPTPLPSSLPCSVWSVDKDYTIATGIYRARALPELYLNLYAREWYLVKRWGYEQYGPQKDFAGETTECQSGSCLPTPTGEFNPQQAWQVLWLELDSDAATNQSDPQYSTDFTCSIGNYPGCVTPTP